MADNTVINAGAGGDTIATDDISGVKFQRVKMVLGADNTNDGDVATANPMPTIMPAIAWAAPTSATVTAASTAILVSNASRQAAVITNDSANVVYLGIGAAAVSGKGIRLNANGGSYEINGTNLSTQAINGIASGSSNVAVHEGT